MKKIRYLLLALLFLIATILGVSCLSDNNSNNTTDTTDTTDTTIITEAISFNGVRIISAEYSESLYYYDDTIEVKVIIESSLERDKVLWLGYSLLDPMGQWIDLHPKKVDLSGKEDIEIVMEYVPENILTGSYTAVLALWDSFPIDENSTRIAEIEVKDAFRVYAQKENFEEFDDLFWMKRDFTLGRSKLHPENVFIDKEKLYIKLPAQTLKGGEIQTREELGFGSYEIEMKLPNAPSSITGFFLYKEPDFFHEIDIEIYNELEAYILFTTYADGDIRNEYKEYLDFDPTADFHRYRFDYYPDRVSFYIDDQLQVSWSEGYSKEPMRLMLNAWYPKWLDGIKPEEDKLLTVNWIRY